MAARRKHSAVPKTTSEPSWIMQPATGIVVVSLRKLTIMTGVTDVEYPMSTKAKWLRKRYIGV
jgi:hypothetical protein